MKVYLGLSVDFIHPGHINVIKEARKLGDVIIGLFTDKAIASYKSLPYLSYEERKLVIENIEGINEIVPQNSPDYTENLLKLKPDIVIHADNWRAGFQKEIRNKVIDTLKQWGGVLHEVPYTDGYSSKEDQVLKQFGTTPDIRRRRLSRLLSSKKIVRIMQAHNGLSSLIVEKTKVQVDNSLREFDGIWSSSLTDSTSRGKPDIEAVDITSRLSTINDILEVTTKPLIFDGDTGGLPEHLAFTVKSLERLGVSAIIIEDKIGLKKNSLLGNDVFQEQDSIENFCYKIQKAKSSQITDDFMVIARVESLILENGIDDAIARSKAYLDAGADGIMIHSRQKDPTEIFDFCKLYNQFDNRKSLIVVPTSYNQTYETELADFGVNIVIYANHLLRSAYPSMIKTAESILENMRSYEADQFCLPVKDILNLIPGTN